MQSFRLIPDNGPSQDEWWLGWDESVVSLRDPDGEPVFEIESSSVHRIVDLYELYERKKVSFLTDAGSLTFEKHPVAVEALQQYLEERIAEDRDFLERLRKQSCVQMGLGIIMFVGAGGLFALYCFWAFTAGDPPRGTWLHWMLIWFGWLIHLVLLVLLAVALAGPAVFVNGFRLWFRTRRIHSSAIMVE